MSFIETRLLDSMAYGFSGGPTWYTLITTLRSGIERRKIMRERPLHKFSASFDSRDADVKDEIMAAFNATRGAAYGFRFRNHLDYQVTDQIIATGTGASQEVQLFKPYTFGGSTYEMTIKKPNNDAVLTADDVPIGAVLDTETGIVEFTAPLDSVVRWSGTFDLPVRFETDDFTATIDTYGVYTIDVSIVEDLSA